MIMMMMILLVYFIKNDRQGFGVLFFKNLFLFARKMLQLSMKAV